MSVFQQLSKNIKNTHFSLEMRSFDAELKRSHERFEDSGALRVHADQFAAKRWRGDREGRVEHAAVLVQPPQNDRFLILFRELI